MFPLPFPLPSAVQLQESIEALLKELSAVGVQKQAALKELEEERRRNQQLEGLLEHKVWTFLLSPHFVLPVRFTSYYSLCSPLTPSTFPIVRLHISRLFTF
jgi:hypothetical protein